ncbi:MAG: GAF domain-containing protein [Thiomicrospira sp.]|uniref:HD domain-containing phosphohydrolase n=1 Tax=Thiomicrospira sp. TaxID=935 RepID=UPI0019E901AA|nr:HD domain-containing phosphohydrolase [Thiomicrospira sp.]MBE0494616.1 GAF domain-containing protein [Thiomicrospira sp.]
MHSIRFLGTHGSRAKSAQTTCIQVSDTTLIDAGNILNGLGDEARLVERVFLTHAHLDHILDLGFWLDQYFETRQKPLQVFGLPETLEALKQHVFNDKVWPDFSNIRLLNHQAFALEFQPIELNKPYEVEPGLVLTPIQAYHTLGSCGYVIEHADQALVFGGDGYSNPEIWPLINDNPSVRSVVLDVSFPNRLSQIAQASQHLTPKLLAQELLNLKRHDVQIYLFHLKPAYEEEIRSELKAMGLSDQNFLNEGDQIQLDTGAIIKHYEPVNQAEQVEKLNRIGVALSAEKNLNHLLEMIVSEAKNLTGADGGTLYLLKDQQLHFTVAQTDSLGIKMGGTSAPISWPPLPLILDDGRQNKKMVAATCALEDRVINIEDVYQAEGFSFDGTKKFDEGTGYRSQSMLVIPLRNFEQKVIGVLQLLNKQDLDQATISFTEEDEAVTLSLASQAAVALTNAQLIDDLENLLESFLNSIIYTMGRKSPYTAGHINRMVALSELLADKIHHDQQTYANITYNDEQAKQIKLAALMHDIGKLATPETVMDKATKLDGHFDRIELVEQRALHIRAEMEKNALRMQLNYPARQAEIETELLSHLNQLEQGLALVRKSNTGGEFLPDEQVVAIQKLADQPFQIGEQTLALISAEEAYCLVVQKGTLTNEERLIINEHAEIGLAVLKQLPFPEKYKDIPHIAGAHHEKINGKGYPLGLKGDEISFDARILAVADVFEALTAHDRPYKKANPLSVAMKILYFMAKDDDLDRGLVKFFYQSGLYLEYAHQYLPAELIDEVSINFSDL